MKNVLKIVGVLFAAGIIYIAYTLANPVSPKETIGYSSENKTFQVVYSRPYKNDRLIFGPEKDGALVPFGKYWRTGANAATTFETSSDVLFNGEKLRAGKYSLFTFPNEKRWKIALGSESNVFFAVSRPDPEFDILKTSVTPQSLEKPLEQFTMDFSDDSLGVSLNLAWDKTTISIPLE